MLFMPLHPAAPVNLPTFQATNLPDPTKYEGSLIYVGDHAQPAISNGTQWLLITLGASL